MKEKGIEGLHFTKFHSHHHQSWGRRCKGFRRRNREGRDPWYHHRRTSNPCKLPMRKQRIRRTSIHHEVGRFGPKVSSTVRQPYSFLLQETKQNKRKRRKFQQKRFIQKFGTISIMYPIINLCHKMASMTSSATSSILLREGYWPFLMGWRDGGQESINSSKKANKNIFKPTITKCAKKLVFIFLWSSKEFHNDIYNSPIKKDNEEYVEQKCCFSQ
jgi:hypothetical protein